MELCPSKGEANPQSYAVLYLIHELTLAWQTFIIPKGEKQSKSTLGGLADSCTYASTSALTFPMPILLSVTATIL